MLLRSLSGHDVGPARSTARRSRAGIALAGIRDRRFVTLPGGGIHIGSGVVGRRCVMRSTVSEASDGRGCCSPVSVKPVDWYSANALTLPSVTQSSTSRAPDWPAHSSTAPTRRPPTPHPRCAGAVHIAASLSSLDPTAVRNEPTTPIACPSTSARKIAESDPAAVSAARCVQWAAGNAASAACVDANADGLSLSAASLTSRSTPPSSARILRTVGTSGSVAHSPEPRPANPVSSSESPRTASLSRLGCCASVPQHAALAPRPMSATVVPPAGSVAIRGSLPGRSATERRRLLGLGVDVPLPRVEVAIAEELVAERDAGEEIILALEDVTQRKLTIPAGTRIPLLLGAANRAPDGFGDGQFNDAHRACHLTVGGGVHRCIGHLLARAELTEALRTLPTMLTDLRITGPISWRPPTGASAAQPHCRCRSTTDEPQASVILRLAALTQASAPDRRIERRHDLRIPRPDNRRRVPSNASVQGR